MIKINEMPFLIYLLFEVVYFSIGDSSDRVWSGIFFLVNYMLIFWLFTREKNKIISRIGISLSVSLFIFSAIKFFIYPEIEKFCIFILFIIAIISILYLQKRKIR